jgi:hypothetical protein
MHLLRKTRRHQTHWVFCSSRRPKASLQIGSGHARPIRRRKLPVLMTPKASPLSWQPYRSKPPLFCPASDCTPVRDAVGYSWIHLEVEGGAGVVCRPAGTGRKQRDIGYFRSNSPGLAVTPNSRSTARGARRSPFRCINGSRPVANDFFDAGQVLLDRRINLPCPPPSSGMYLIPLASNATRMASKVAGCADFPFSIRVTVAGVACALRASSLTPYSALCRERAMGWRSGRGYEEKQRRELLAGRLRWAGELSAMAVAIQPRLCRGRSMCCWSARPSQPPARSQRRQGRSRQRKPR